MTVHKEGMSQPMEEKREKIVVRQYGSGINKPETQYIQSSETITTNRGSDYGKIQSPYNRYQSPAKIYRKEETSLPQ